MKKILFSILVIYLISLTYQINSIKEPSSYYQRYRRSDYSTEKPYYQWYYFWIRDDLRNEDYAITYGTSLCGTVGECQNQGAYVLFCGYTQEDACTKTERYTADNFFADDQGLNFNIWTEEQSPFYNLKMIDENTIHLQGTMNHSEKVNITKGCAVETVIEWNLTISRVYGWYGQPLIEIPNKLFGMGVIQWNTYSHNSLIEGYIKIGDKQLDLNKEGSRFRVYCDMNWGINLPINAPNTEPIDYAWGWYYARKPANDSKDDVSIIAGSGKTYSGPIFKVMNAKFGDIRASNISIQSEYCEMLVDTFLQNHVQYTNDGTVLNFDVSRGKWVDFTDNYGVARVPLQQNLTMETTNHILYMNYSCKVDNYKRLIFPQQFYIFSDFEALGVQVHVQLIRKSDNFKELDFITNSGGLEFGYKAPINNNTQKANQFEQIQKQFLNFE